MSTLSVVAFQPRFDDLNLAEAALISALTRLKPGETTWSHEFEIAGREMHVECLGNAYGFPHGPDNDMMLVLNNLYLEQGKPADKAVHCSAYALLQMLGRTDSSQNYRIMHDSLTRLAGTLYKVAGWIDHPGGTSRRVTFRFLERVEEVEGEARNLNLKSFGAGTQLKITLDAVVAASLSSSRVRPFDLDFMLKLSGSQSRMLFRLLDTIWYGDPEAARRGYLEFEVVELGKLLRLFNLRLDSIRRLITPINEELIASEFLLSATFEGRGQKQRLRYVLNPQRPDYPLSVEQLALVGRIKAHGIGDGQARDFVRRRAPALVRERLGLVDSILAGPVRIRRSQAAYAWDILNDESGKYGKARAETVLSQTALSPTGPVALPRDVRAEAERDLDQQIEALKRLSPEDQWVKHRGALKVLLQKHLGAELWKVLERRCLSGALEAATIHGEVNAAIAAVQLQGYVGQLQRQLGEAD